MREYAAGLNRAHFVGRWATRGLLLRALREVRVQSSLLWSLSGQRSVCLATDWPLASLGSLNHILHYDLVIVVCNHAASWHSASWVHVRLGRHQPFLLFGLVHVQGLTIGCPGFLSASRRLVDFVNFSIKGVVLIILLLDDKLSIRSIRLRIPHDVGIPTSRARASAPGGWPWQRLPPFVPLLVTAQDRVIWVAIRLHVVFCGFRPSFARGPHPFGSDRWPLHSNLR